MSNSGIYKIVDLDSGSFYIGKSIDFRKRFRDHRRRLCKNIHFNYKIQNDWNVSHNFVFVVIEYCGTSDLFAREQYYLNTLKPNYNIAENTIAPMLGRKHSKETLFKFRQRPVVRGKDHHAFGTKYSLERRQEISRRHKGRRHRPETIIKMRMTSLRLNNHQRLLPYIEQTKRAVVDNFGTRFPSLLEAAKHWNMSVQAVCDQLKGRTKNSRNGAVFTYA